MSTLNTNAIKVHQSLPAPSRANRLARKFFPSHKRITEEVYKDFSEAFAIMSKDFIKANLSVINESIWSFKFDKTFFCIILNPGEQNEESYFGMCD